MKPILPEHLLELAALLKDRVGLHVRRDGHAALRIAVAARLDELADVPDAGSYLALLRSEDAGDEELRRLLPLVTVGKTSFFRDERQFRALEAILPGLVARARGGGRPVSIWSAGCATGEEPYSIAMTAAEAGAGPEHVEILATDLNPEAIAFAAHGAYEPRRVRDIPEPFLSRHFDRDGDRYHVRPGLRRFIAAIRPHNLVSSIFPRPVSGGWDVIFCRNVIIYFDTPTTQGVLTQFHNALAPGGYLFLGYSESLFRLFEGFELTEVAGAFVYRRPETSGRVGAPAAALAGPVGPARPHLVPMPAQPPAVRHVAFAPPERAHTPVPLPSSLRGGAGAEPPLAPQEYLDGAVALFADGRFGAARELLERLLEKGGEDLAVRLTLANLYGILRQPDRARESYVAALALEPLCAEAHLFYGIHLLAAGNAEEAALELSRALFLDPDLALAHYYLGRCREAERDVVRARLAYRNAIEAHRRRPDGKRQAFLGYYPDVPEDGDAFARAAEYALAAL
ncbi:CheR family methyltransferase [Anaeromyxobacter oryzisoli]|uniref:CheR family methyltransferase n=1 Tax=Anaeromyxobacter oryzisoli TaxID=2925408 RepID=UPI001F59001B|nr:CheR family methyltransferase [Anaeromyxobacter sp. SG63]